MMQLSPVVASGFSPLLYAFDSAFLMFCMVCMFVELFYFQMQYRCRIARGKETPAKTRRILGIVTAALIAAQVVFSILHIPVRPGYLLMLTVPAFFFRFGMYENGVYFFGRRYPWEKIAQCQVVSAKGGICIHYVTAKGKSFHLTFSADYQEYILQLLQDKGFIPSGQN